MLTYSRIMEHEGVNLEQLFNSIDIAGSSITIEPIRAYLMNEQTRSTDTEKETQFLFIVFDKIEEIGHIFRFKWLRFEIIFYFGEHEIINRLNGSICTLHLFGCRRILLKITWIAF